MALINLIALLENYSVLISFAAGLGSEDILLFLAILSGSGAISIWTVVFFGFLGTFIHDSIFYFIGKSRFLERINKRFKPKNKSLLAYILKKKKGTYFIPLMLSKFIYGVRILALFYASQRESKYSRFALFNFLSLVIWFSIMIPIGWFAGRGFTLLLSVIRGTEKVIATIILALILFYIVKKVLFRVVKKAS